MEELFAYFFEIYYIKFEYKNPPILTPIGWVDVNHWLSDCLVFNEWKKIKVKKPFWKIEINEMEI